MTPQEKIAATAPYGLDCFNCAAHEANITPEYRTRAVGIENEADMVRGMYFNGRFVVGDKPAEK